MLLDPIVGRSDGLIIGLRNFISASQRQLRDQTLQTRPRLGPLLARSCMWNQKQMRAASGVKPDVGAHRDARRWICGSFLAQKNHAGGNRARGRQPQPIKNQVD